MLYAVLILIAATLWYTRDDWTIRPRTMLQYYLLFVTVFYFYRWTFRWGPPDTTIYQGDAPIWVRVIKDFVYFGFVVVWFYRDKFKLSGIFWYIFPFVAWLCFASYIKLAGSYDTSNVLFHWHTSLEYVPLAFLSLDEKLEGFLKFAIGCCWIVVAFLALEALSGRPSGFFKNQIFFSRYGSIFGSPNELGTFAVLALLGLLVFGDRISARTRLLLVPALALTLVLSESRSAIAGLIAGMIAILPRSKKWVLTAACAFGALYICLFVVLKDYSVMRELISRVEDASAATRVLQFDTVRTALANWGFGGLLLGSWGHIDQENYYFSILMRSGIVGVLLFFIPAAATVIHARRLFLRAGVIALLVASCFVPYPDVFPINVYFWLIVGAVWSLPQRHMSAAASGLSRLRSAEQAGT